MNTASRSARRSGPVTYPGLRLSLLASVLVAPMGGCLGNPPTVSDTVDLGDNFEAPDRRLDEDVFHCIIQPEVITRHSCASGLGSDSGGCHTERSALRLEVVQNEPRCDGDALLGNPPINSVANLDRIRASVGIDADSSPFYRRPIGLDSHPRIIFDEGSEAAELIRAWIDSGSF